MFDLVRKLMMARELKMEEGEITLFGSAVQFIPTLLLVDILHDSKEKDEQGRILYESAKNSTKAYFEYLKNIQNMGADNLIKWAQNIFAMAGWGKAKIISSNFEKGQSIIRVESPSFALEYLKKYGISKEPICHLIRGGFAGTTSVVCNNDSLEAIELKCTAMGNPYCEILVKTKNEFVKDYKNSKNKYIRNQLDLFKRQNV